MIKLKKLLRVVIIFFAVFAIGILIAGVWVYRVSATWEPDMTSFLSDEDVVTLQVFLDRHTLEGAKNEPSEAVDGMQMLALGYDAGQFRDDAVETSTIKAMAELPQVAPGALQDLLEGEVSAEFPLIWPYVMSGSFMVIGNSLGTDPIVAFYNPYFDVALLTKWSFNDYTETEEETGFKLMEAVPSTGRAFIENRSSLATDQPIWTDSEGIFEVRIVNAAQEFVAAFEKRFPPFGRESVVQLTGDDTAAKSAAISVAENRVFFLMRWIIEAQDPKAPVNYADAIKQLKKALSADYPDKLEALLPEDNPQTAGMFFQLGSDIREEMRPYLVVDKNVIFIDPINLPTAFISVYFQPVEDEYIPALVALFNLDASYPGN